MKNNPEKIIQKLKNSKVHVIGVAGIEGSEIALFLNQIEADPSNITLHQLTPEKSFKENFFKYNQAFSQDELEQRYKTLLNSNFTFRFDKDYLKDIEEADIIFAPQSLFMHDSNKPLLELQDTLNTITNLYFQLIPCPIIAVTGSNGKSTTTQLIYKIINNSSKHKAWITGNDRSTKSLLLKLDQIKPEDYVVTEVSNRQLNFLKDHKPFISVITNITENHLTEYDSFQEYIDTKLKLFKNQSQDDHLIINIDNPILNGLDLQSIKPQTHTVSLHSEEAEANIQEDSFAYQNNKILPVEQLNIPGPHNQLNTLQAIMVAKILDIPEPEIIKTLQEFHGLKDRCEIVHKYQNITFINDRQGTSVDSTIQALKGLPKPLILIFGGKNKSMPIQKLAQLMLSSNQINIGIKSPFVDELKPLLNQNLQKVDTMTDAIKTSVKLAQENYTGQEVTVLFSPACEYGPYFSPLPGYDDSEKFNQIVKTYQ